VKLDVGDKTSHTASTGHGVVNALDGALRKALTPFFPQLEKIQLVDYKVRIIDGEEATAAKTRVLIVHTDGETTWGTVGVSDSIIEASWIALTDGLDLFLQKTSA
jgi:2-isopropylmalate synthase